LFCAPPVIIFARVTTKFNFFCLASVRAAKSTFYRYLYFYVLKYLSDLYSANVRNVVCCNFGICVIKYKVLWHLSSAWLAINLMQVCGIYLSAQVFYRSDDLSHFCFILHFAHSDDFWCYRIFSRNLLTSFEYNKISLFYSSTTSLPSTSTSLMYSRYNFCLSLITN
jgi:hypothetical protein